MILPCLERDKIDYFKPTFTLDMNQVALKNPATRQPSMEGLAPLEWNYFYAGSRVELCVTPETESEIWRGENREHIGTQAYKRFSKSLLFKSRPDGTTLTLTEPESNDLWKGIRQIVFNSTSDASLNERNISDVTQIFFHTVASGTLSNSAFITCDNDILRCRSTLAKEVGITVSTPSEAWEVYQPAYGLYKPTPGEITNLWDNQNIYIKRLEDDAKVSV